MAIKTTKMSAWLAANGQAITNASKATMKDAIKSDVLQLYDGIYIMYHRAYEYTDNFPMACHVNQWAAKEAKGEIADGVLLIEGGHHLVIAPTEAASGLPWSSKPVSDKDTSGSMQISGVSTTSDRLTAFNDWNGRANESAIIKGSTTTNITNTEAYAPGFCNKYSRANAKGVGLTAGKWWLPSLAELAMIWANFDKINYALSVIGGSQQLQGRAYWSSTQYSANTAWLLHLGDGIMNDKWKFYQNRVRPVSAFLQ